MVMTTGFHPVDRGSIPLVEDNYFLIFSCNFYTYFNLVPNSLSAAYYNFQHTVPQRSYQRSLNEALCVLQTYFRISL